MINDMRIPQHAHNPVTIPLYESAAFDFVSVVVVVVVHLNAGPSILALVCFDLVYSALYFWLSVHSCLKTKVKIWSPKKKLFHDEHFTSSFTFVASFSTKSFN